jgi:hypothetical protein
MLALTVIMAHPQPQEYMLQPYMHSNLAMTSRTWMGTCILTGISPLLPPLLQSHNIQIQPTGQSAPINIVTWNDNPCPTTPTNTSLPKATSTLTKTQPVHLTQHRKEQTLTNSHKKQRKDKTKGLPHQQKVQLTIDTILGKKDNPFSKYQGV